MPGIRFTTLTDWFTSTLELSGANIIASAPSLARPLYCRVNDGLKKHNLEIYLWAITPGGKGRGRPSERRIQITGVEKFSLSPGTQIVLGGFNEETGVYAFWDVRRHLGFTAGSPSLQISLGTLEQAAVNGFASESRSVREGEETAIAVHPDYLLWYIQEYDNLYDCAPELSEVPSRLGEDPQTDREFIDTGDDEATQSRRHRLVTVLQNFRDAKFRPAVLRAYGYRCCVTGIALRLVDAAHIVPVANPNSTDGATNGLALNPTLHRAYDTGLLGILPGGSIRLNDRIAKGLAEKNLADGLEKLRLELPQSIQYPAMREFWPNDNYLHQGLVSRGWSDTEIAG